MNGGSTTMLFDNSGATLSNNANNGAPVQLHGIANGTSANDAVNFSQLNQVNTQLNSRIDQLDTKVDKNATRAFSGIAQIAAMQAIPAPIAGKNYSIGMGGGFYAGQQAMAFGGKANVGEHLNVSASVANGFGSNKDMAASVGAGFSW
jgi:autotransporter adhesin